MGGHVRDVEKVDALVERLELIEGIILGWEEREKPISRIAMARLRHCISDVRDGVSDLVSASSRRTSRIKREVALTGLEQPLL